MNPSRPFILRPVATTLLMVAILLSGLIAYRFLPISRCRKWTTRPSRWSPCTPAPARRS